MRLNATIAVLTAQLTTSGAAIAEPSPASSRLDEIVVTAQRIEQNIQDVPLSVVAFSGDDLDARNVQQIADLGTRIPNVQITGDPNWGRQGGQFTVRGIPNVANYEDGVFLLFGWNQVAREIIEVERVEVLRGPQGTLFGEAATGGAIQYITKPPAGELGVRASATIGDYARRDITAVADWPLGDSVKTKWTVGHLARDGFVDSREIDRSFGDMDGDVYRGDVLWTPTETFRLRFSAEKDSARANGQPRILANVFEPQPPVSHAQFYLMAGVPFSNLTYASGFPGGEVGRRQNRSVYRNDGWKHDEEHKILDLEWNISDKLTLKSITGDISVANDGSIDHCACDLNLLFLRERADGASFSEELQLHGEVGRVGFIAGVYYGKAHLFTYDWLWQFQDFRNNPDLLARLNQVLPIAPPGNFESGTMISGHTSAAFGQATVRLTDKASVTFGLRRQEGKGEMASPLFPLTINEAVIGGDPIGQPRAYKFDKPWPQSDTSTVPRSAFQYAWNDSLMTYVSYAEGASAGGINLPGIPGLPEVIPYDPETVKTTEVGLRSNWWNGRLRFNLTGFRTDWADIQVPVYLPDPSISGAFLPIVVIMNAAAAKADGMEAELLAAPSERWHFDFGLGVLHTRYTHVGGALTITSDSPFANAPKRSYSVGVQNDRNFRNGARLTTRLDYGWVDDYVTMAEEAFQVTQKSFGLLSAQVSYRFHRDRYRLTLFGTNLTDEYYFDSAVSDPGFGYTTATLGRPREIGLTFRVSFD